MHYMVMLIVHNMNNWPDILDAWEAAKVPGMTILESAGLGTLRQIALRGDMPLMPSISDLFRSREHPHRTFFSVVEGEEMVERLIQVTEEILGDMTQPKNGILFVLPVSRVVGFRGAQQREQNR